MDIVFGELNAQFSNVFEELRNKMENPFESSSSTSREEDIFGTTADPFVSQTVSAPDTKQPSTRYAIVDLFWIPHYKLTYNKPLEQNEAAFLIMSFNAVYGNLRCEFRSVSENSFKENAIIKSNCQRILTFNIYPEEAINILEWINKVKQNPNVGPYSLIERLITESDWTPPRTILSFINTDNIKGIRIHSGNYHFDLVTPAQLKMFMKSLDFVTSGLNWIAMFIQIKPVVE